MKYLSPPGRLVEILLHILSMCNFIIGHTRSGELVNVDYLTREGCSGSATPKDLDIEKDTKDVTISSIVIQRGGLDTANWKEEQDKDVDLKVFNQWLNDGNHSSKDGLILRSTAVQINREMVH